MDFFLFLLLLSESRHNTFEKTVYVPGTSVVLNVAATLEVRLILAEEPCTMVVLIMESDRDKRDVVIFMMEFYV